MCTKDLLCSSKYKFRHLDMTCTFDTAHINETGLNSSSVVTVTAPWWVI